MHRHFTPAFALLLALLLLLGPGERAQAADGITRGTTYSDAPDSRYLLGGTWLFRLDPAGVGLTQKFQRLKTTDGWLPTAVPRAWNAGDDSVTSFQGTVGWYRKDFKLPDARSRLNWLVRFESVNYRSRAWLNGKLIGRNTGAYLPFELRLPRNGLKLRGTNHLVVRVDNRRLPTDFPPSGLTGAGDPAGGWWNYGGILREVYLQRVDRIDVTSVVVRPDLPCGTCAANIGLRVITRNYADRALRVSVSGTYGTRRVRLGTKSVPAARLRELHGPRPHRRAEALVSGDAQPLQGALPGRVGRPQARLLPGRQRHPLDQGRRRPRPAQRQEGGAARRRPARGRSADGLRDHTRAPGSDRRAGQGGRRDRHPLALPAASRHPRSRRPRRPADLVGDPRLRGQDAVPQARGGAQARRQGACAEHHRQPEPPVGHALVDRQRAVGAPRPRAGAVHRAARSATPRRSIPTRPVALAVAGYPSAGCRPQYAGLDVIGVNEYFGWYPGPNGQIADRDALPEYLDSVRACYPKKAIFISEFGAEANREGPVEEKGTFPYQQDFVNYHLGVYATRPWLSGAIYWALQEFRVRPNWDGGNPHPASPIHAKGLLRFDGAKKPAWFDVQRLFAATPQLAVP